MIAPVVPGRVRALLLILLFATPIVPARAASIVVDSLTDGAPANDGSCTLREAILNADFGNRSTDCAAGTGTDTITFAVNGAILLSSGLPGVTRTLTISGPGVAISGANAYEIFTVDGTVTLNDLTIANGFSAGDGGAVVNYGTLTVNRCTFQNNHAGGSGGAILSYGAPLTITDSEFASNSAANGGALYPRFPGSVTTISGSTFHDNTAVDTTNGWGGAILLWDGAPATVTHTAFSTNSAYLYGGAIYLQGASVLTATDVQFDHDKCTVTPGAGGAVWSEGTVTITAGNFFSNHVGNGGAIFENAGATTLATCTFHDNWADFGGAVQALGVLNVTDSTFEHNGYDDTGRIVCVEGGAVATGGGTVRIDRSSFVDGGCEIGAGLMLGGDVTVRNATVSGNMGHRAGGIEAFNATRLSIVNSTIVDNTATDPGYPGGVRSVQSTVSLANSIVADNPGGNCAVLNGTAPQGTLSGSFCLSSDDSCMFGGGRDSVAVKLGTLGNYGGPGPVHMPMLDSPAIDGGSPGPCPQTDERGKPRPAGFACDVGAVERQADDSDTPTPSTTSTTIGTHPGSTTTTTTLQPQCATFAACEPGLHAALPVPRAVSRKAKATARALAHLERIAVSADASAEATGGTRRARRSKHARSALTKLVAKAQAADARGRLEVPLAPIQSAVGTLLTLLP